MSKARKHNLKGKIVMTRIAGELICTVVSFYIRILNHFLLMLFIFLFQRLVLIFGRRLRSARKCVQYVGSEKNRLSLVRTFCTHFVFN